MYKEIDIEPVRDYMLQHKETVAVAESVTAGHVQAALSLGADASKYFQGGITVYNLTQKTRHLMVDPVHALSCNCVSEKVAEEMAIGACKLFTSDWGIGVTGYATLIPEGNINSLFAFYSLAYKGENKFTRLLGYSEKDPLKVQVYYATEIVKSLSQYLKSIAEIVRTDKKR